MSPAALIVGKFYPPHAGHLVLLREALRIRTSVVVLCFGSVGDSFTPQQRLTALTVNATAMGLDTDRVVGSAGFDETPFDLDDDAVWASHLEVFATGLRGLPEVDVLVTSEGYGPRLARGLGLQHHLADMGRSTVAVSATLVRADVDGCWNSLGPGTKGLLATRVVILGAESTGTTTVAESLASRLRMRGGIWSEVGCVPEFGRELTERKQNQEFERTGRMPLSVDWEAEDFEEVVARQSALEEGMAARGAPILVCDTDAFATPVWERRYMGADRASLDQAGLGIGDVYLLTDHVGVPFVQDGTRDGEDHRSQMTRWFAESLAAHAKPWAFLSGSLSDRLALAERIADQVMARKLAFVEPI